VRKKLAVIASLNAGHTH